MTVGRKSWLGIRNKRSRCPGTLNGANHHARTHDVTHTHVTARKDESTEQRERTPSTLGLILRAAEHRPQVREGDGHHVYEQHEQHVRHMRREAERDEQGGYVQEQVGVADACRISKTITHCAIQLDGKDPGLNTPGDGDDAHEVELEVVTRYHRHGLRNNGIRCQDDKDHQHRKTDEGLLPVTERATTCHRHVGARSSVRLLEPADLTSS